MTSFSPLPMPFIAGPPTPQDSFPPNLDCFIPQKQAACITPLTRSQQGIWLEYLMSPRSTQYNLTLKITLDSNKDYRSDLGDLFLAIRTLTQRHGILRSTFHAEPKTQRPYMAEHAFNTSSPIIRVLPASLPDVNQLVRQGFDLSSEFAVRWIIVIDHRKLELYVVSHHIAMDGTAMSALSVELFGLLRMEQPVAASAVYSQAHLYEAAFISSPAFAEAKAFWVGQISKAVPIEWKKTVFPSSKSPEYRSIETWADFPKTQLAGWANKYKTSWFRVAIAAISLLIRTISEPRHCSSQSLTVAFGGRPSGFESVIGHFANALPISVPSPEMSDCDTELLFDRLVNAVSKLVSQAKKHERFSSVDLHRSARTEGEGFLAPRSQVAITLSPKLSRSECSLYPVEGVWDLFFCFLEAEDSVSLGVIYDPSIFSKSAVCDMKAEFLNLVSLTAASTRLHTSDIRGLPHPRLLPKDTDLGTLADIRVHRLLQEQTIRHPDMPALYAAETGKCITYAELNNLTNQRAHYLRSIGVSAGQRVLAFLKRDFSLVIWIIAVWKAGATIVVSDQSHPFERNKLVVDMAEPTVVVKDDESPALARQLLAGFSGQVIDVLHSQFSHMSPDNLVDETKETDLACIIFTSGSMGRPKGVMIEHRNIAAFIVGMRRSTDLGAGSRILQFAPFTFDASILELSMTFSSGATLCLVQSPKILIGEYLADMIDANEIDFVEMTPTAFSTLPTSRALRTLKQVSLGGEACNAAVLDFWKKRIDVLNAYGPTETCVIIATQSQKFEGADYPPSVKPSQIVGVPHKGTAVYISDPGFEHILPPGTEGEVCISGSQVCRGYVGQNSLTAEKFVVHPENGVHMYRSGDRGLLHPNGALQILGRLDREVKVRGFRIDLDDVERTIIQCDSGVRTASVQVNAEGTVLRAFIAPEHVDVAALRERILQKLPAYMVPSTITALPSLPCNVNDKVDHKGIAAMQDTLLKQAAGQKQSFTPVDQPAIPPANHTGSHATLNAEDPCLAQHAVSPVSVDDPVFMKLRDIWHRVLGIDNAQVNSNFFDLGGNSLLVLKLLQEIKSMWSEVTVSLVALFHQSTLLQQVALLRSSGLASVPSPPRAPKCAVVVPSSPVVPSKPSPDSTSIAIIGLAGKFPGADDADALYDLLSERRDGITTFTSAKPSVPMPEGAVYVPRKGLLANVEDFDHEYWNLSKAEATDMDPQQRLFLDISLAALEDAGYVSTQQGRNNVGLFVGAALNTYHTVTEPSYGDPFARANRAALAPSISARTAYHLNLQGPNVTLNVQCASGTAALSLAVDHLNSGSCDMALAGGVSVQFPQEGYISQKGAIFSSTGYCRPFDHRSDGTVPSDGVCAVVLKRLPDAVANGDSIYAVISGVALGSDGHAEKAGLVVPSPRGQAEVIKAAWAKANLTPENLVYVELHGSGTPIGDALELEGLNLALSDLGSPGLACTVGSNKGNIGNTQHTSGLVSLIKLCKSIQHGSVPPIHSLDKISPLLEHNVPFVFAVNPTPVPTNAILAVSCAGFGGVNTHTVLASPPEGSRRLPGFSPPKRQRNNQRLMAPRSRPTVNSAPINIARAISLSASQILNLPIDDDTNLRDAGLDSTGQVKLVRIMLDLLGPPSLGVMGFVDPVCTPKSIAAIYTRRRERSQASVSPPWLSVLKQGLSGGLVYVLLAPGGGSCALYADLVGTLHGTTVLGLEHPNYSQSSDKEWAVGNLADLYLDAIESHYPGNVKFVIAGHSFGGIVAYDLSMKMERRGRHVACLAMFDSPWPTTLSAEPTPIQFLQNVYGVTDYTPSCSSSHSNESFVLESLPDHDTSSCPIPMTAAKFAEAVAQESKGLQLSDWEVMAQIYFTNVHAVHEYIVNGNDVKPSFPALYVGVMGRNNDIMDSSAAMWSKHLPGLIVKDIDATHSTLCTGRNAEVIASLIGELVFSTMAPR